MLRQENQAFKEHPKWLTILPASGQKHGLFDENGAGQQDVPAASNVVRAGRDKKKGSILTERALIKNQH